MSVGRKLSVGDVVLAGFKICSDRWKDLLKVAAMTVLPVSIFGTLLVATYTPDALLDVLSDPSVDPATTDRVLRSIPSADWTSFGIAAFVYVVAGLVANVLALNACLLIALHHHENLPLSHADALRAGFSRIGSMLWLTILSGALIVIGLLLVILPGIWLFVSWSVAPVILLRENMKGRKAMGRSFKMVKPAFWLVLLVLVLEFACLFVLQAITGVLPGLLLPAAAEDNSFAVFFTLSLGGSLVGLIAVALHAAMITELYFALRPEEVTPETTASV